MIRQVYIMLYAYTAVTYSVVRYVFFFRPKTRHRGLSKKQINNARLERP